MAEMVDALSLWRSPLDKVALAEANAIATRQPRCSIGYGEDFHLMTIYNFGYYIDNYGPGAESALKQMFTEMNSTPAGGLGFIPQQSFTVNISEGPFDVPDQCNIVASGGGGIHGASGGTSFYHFILTPPGTASTFLTCNPSLHTSGGIYLRGLAFQWGNPSSQGDTCVAAGVENVRAVRCTFTDCPVAFNANGVSCTLEQCTINYTVATPTNTTAVILRAAQCAVVGPGVFSQTSQAGGSGGASGCTCISIQGAPHAVIADMQIYEWSIGVDFSQGGTGQTLTTHITNCEIECWKHALKIVLPNSSSTAAGIKVTSCTLAKVSDSDDGNAIVTIDANGGDLHDVTLLGCTVFNMASAQPNQHGLSILSGTDIKIIGGTYSGNSSSGGAGIAITGAATDIQIIGANLRPTYPEAPADNAQQYALLIGASGTLVPSGVLVSGCDMTGYGSAGPTSISGSPTYLRLTDCPGYNDRNAPLTATSMQLMSGVSASDCSTPYYGPSVITYSNSMPVTLIVFGQSITASMGIIFLPSPYDSFSFSAVPGTFSWTGK